MPCWTSARAKIGRSFEVRLCSPRAAVSIRWEIVFALKTQGDRQFYTWVLPAKLCELAVAELTLVDEIAKRKVGELDPIRTAGEARGAGSDKGN